MKRLLVLFVLLFTVLFSYTVLAQEAGSVRRNHKLTIPEKIHKLSLDPLPAGTYSVGSGGYFPTIDSAFNKLSIDGIAGEVILELTDNLYTAPAGSSFILNGPINGAGSSSRVTIRPAENVAVTINGDGEAVLLFYDVSYLTIDGINLQGSTSLKVHAFYNSTGTQWNDALDFYGDCDYVQVKNITASSDDVNRFSGAILFSYNNQSQPDNGLISGVFIPVVNIGIYLIGNGTLNPTNFVISNNHIGSPSDSLIVNGIENEYADWTIIENNHIENMRKGFLTGGVYFVEGINSYISDNVVIRNNVIHNIAATVSPTRAQGIFISAGGQIGENNWIYNNIVYDIRTYVPNIHWLAGIFVHNNNPKVDYNTVWLSEGNDVAPTSGSSAIYIYPGTTTPTVRNNIFVNTRNDEPYAAVAARCAVADVSDYNDLYVSQFDHSYVGSMGGTFYKTLAEWQATGKDLNSLNESVNFVSPTDLHINNNFVTLLNGHATPIAGITTDFDGDTRSTMMPDIGADEFDVDPNATVWQMHNSNFPSNVLVVDFSSVNEQVCWAVGQVHPGNTTPYAGYIRTTDGGSTWVCDTIPGLTDTYSQQVFAIDASTAYVAVYVFSGQSSKGIYKTTNGGTTWTRQTAYNTSLYGPGYIHFFDFQNGVVIGDPNIETYTTTNGGLTWNPVTMPSALPDETTWLGESRITAIGNTVWCSTNRRLFKSTDKGYTWTVLVDDPQYYDWLPSLSLQDDLTGIYALKIGGYGTDHIYKKTTDGGATWNTLSNSVLDNLAPSCVQHIPGTSSAYVAVGGRTPTMRGTAVTYDAGETWTLIDTLGVFLINFTSDAVGWGSQFGTNVVYKYVGPRIISSVEEEIVDIVPTGYSLSQNYPNPFNPSTTFRYSIPQTSKVVIKVYDILGNEIAILIDEEKIVGTYELTWNAENLPSGVYFYQLKAGDYVSTKKMILLK